MLPYRHAYSFSGEPGTNQNATDWLSAVETHIHTSVTNREKVDLFYSMLSKKSPARKRFNKLPDEGRRRWHLVRQEFEARWCRPADTPSFVAPLSTEEPADFPNPLDSFQETEVNNHSSTPRTSATVSSYWRSTSPFSLSSLLKLSAARDIRGVGKLCRQAADTEHQNFALIWDLAFEAGKSFAQQKHGSLKKLTITTTTSDAALQINPSVESIPKPTSSLSPSVPTLISPTLIPVTAPVPPPILPLLTKFSWADDSVSLPIIPLVKAPRDLSCLRSEGKPFGTLRHRHRRRFRTSRCIPVPPVYFPSPYDSTSKSAPAYQIPSQPLHSSTPALYPSTAAFPPPVLDWDRDPRLFQLSRLLRSLGWSYSQNPRVEGAFMDNFL